MANVKISELTELTAPADADRIPIVDESESSGEKTKYITHANYQTGVLTHATALPFIIGGTSQLSVIDGAVEPTTDNDIDLGGTNSFKGLKMKGTRVWNGVSQSMSTVSASGTTLDITGLTAGYIYEIVYRLYFTGTGKYVYFNFNADSGANYKVVYQWGYYNGATTTEGTVTNTTATAIGISPFIDAGLITGVLRMGYGYDNTQVLFDSRTTFYGTDLEYGNYSNFGFYDGAADVTQVTFTTTGTALGGEAIIKRLY